MNDGSPEPPPVACELPPEGRSEREREIRALVRSGSRAVTVLEDGYELAFPGERAWVERLAELVAFERECCPFLTLEIVCRPGRGPVLLRMRGPEGSKELLTGWLPNRGPGADAAPV